jgi:small-conductance mechanosensitive channel
MLMATWASEGVRLYTFTRLTADKGHYATRHPVGQALQRTGTDTMLVNFLGSIIYAVLLIAVLLAAVDSLGVNVTSLLAILGAAGLAVGLAH